MHIKVGTTGFTTPPLANVAKHAARNEAQGFDSIWWPDHLMGWFPDSIWIPELGDVATTQPTPHTFIDPVVGISLAAGATSEVALGTAVTEPIRRHPAMLAQSFLSLHHATNGRTILGIGAGEAENIEPYGFDFSRPVARLAEAIEVIRLLWEADGPVDYDGEFYTLRDAPLGLGGLDVATPGSDGASRPAFPPIWLAAHGPRMLELCGRHADGWIPTSMPVDVYAESLGQIRSAATAAGRDPDAIEPAMWGWAICDETHELCHEALRSPLVKATTLIAGPDAFARHGLEHPFGADFYGLRDYIPTRFGAEKVLRALDALSDEFVHDYIPHGTPDELAAYVRRYGDAGLRHFVPWNISFFGNLDRLKPSYDCFAELTTILHDS